MLATAGIGADAAGAFSSFGGEIVVIDSVSVGSPVMTTYDQCSGYVDQNTPVVPVTVKASFITSPGVTPTGPYGGVLSWDGGFGAEDDHFGSGQAHAPVQFFHVLARADSSFHGQGKYTFDVFAQDVGLAGGYAEIEKTVSLPGLPPSGGGARVKCTIAKPYGLGNILANVAVAGLKKVDAALCPECIAIYDAVNNIRYYNSLFNGTLGDAAIDDPPDSDYQQIAQPQAPPVLAPPSGLTAAQQTAVTNLEQQYATDIGLARAILVSEDRVWGADNAGSRYWYVQQMDAVGKYANELAGELGAYQQLYASLQSSMASDLPPFSITYADALNSLVARSNGFSSSDLATLAQLGATAQDEQQMIDDAIAVDPAKMVTSDGVSALFAQNEADFAPAMQAIAQWASEAVKGQPPVVSDVSPGTIPSGGGTKVTITGTNLSTVSAIAFGRSTPLSGEGSGTNCSDTQCTTYAPPGHGTVDVTAIGPGGPSDRVAQDQVTYTEPPKPQIDRIFPTQGSKAGGTSVSIWGSGLSGGIVYFGPTAASSWNCTDTLCSADAPSSASVGSVDVQVVTPGGTSDPVSGDKFTFLDTATPPPAPSVTSVSPSTGTDSGGDTVTITGSGFTGATEVSFGQDPAPSFQVIDDSHIQATTPATYQAETDDVTVTGPGGASAVNQPGDQFTFQAAAPTLTGISPTSGSDLGGDHFTLTGTHLGAGADTSSVYIGGQWVQDAVCSETQCQGTTPPGTDGPADVEVNTANGQATLSQAFTFKTGPAPTITKISPDTGAVEGGNPVVISGTNLETGQVSFGATPADNVTCTPTVCTATAPAAPKAEQVDIHVTTNAGTTATTAADEYDYVHLAKPVVDSVTPAGGYINGFSDVHITGTDLTDGTVAFGSAQASDVKCSQTACDVKSPTVTTPGTVDVKVTTPSGTSQTSAADQFSYVVPTVTGISPAQGWTVGGTTVTITGTDLGGSPTDPVDETIYFGNIGTDGTCLGTSCTVTSPAATSNATSKIDVRVQPSLGPESSANSNDSFTYVPRPAPTVTSVTPNSGTDQGGDQVTITGTNLDSGSVKFGATGASGTCGSTSCTVTSPRYASDAAVDVTVTTPTLNGSLTSATTSADRFTYHPQGVPQITGVSPNHGSVAGGTVVTLTGSNLTNSGISFGGVRATAATCSESSCAVTAPAGNTTGTVDIVASTSGGSSPTSSADSFTYELPPAPTVTGVSPADGPASGDSTVTISGTNLRGGSVSFGGAAATGVTCDDTSCTAISPPGGAGAIDVTVTTPGGTSTASSADKFTYSPVTLAEHSIPGVTGGTGAGQIVRGVGGDLWFTMPNLDKVGRIAADGTITTYPTLDTGSRPFGITEGPDGQMWYAERNLDKLVSLDSSGTQKGYQLPGNTGDLDYVSSGPDGRLWFTLGASGTIGAMTTSGQITLYHLPDPTVYPYQIVTGPDGRLWFTEVYGSSMGAISTDGTITEYPLPDSNDGGWGLAVGADNRLWFGEWAARSIGAITTSGHVTNYPVPTAGDDPQGVISGADGRIWFTAPDSDLISALDPASGEVTNYPLPAAASGGSPNEAPRYLAIDGAGTLWVTENAGPHLLSVGGITAAVAPTVSGVSPNHGGAGTSVTISGAQLGGATAVDFGSTPASAYTVVDPTHITATAPAGSGIVDVSVTTPNGKSASSSSDRFSYAGPIAAQPSVTDVSPDSGSTNGGTHVTIQGSDLSGGTVAFGGTAATNVSCTATSCTATAPAANTGGAVDVTVTTSGGTSATSDADRFAYLTPPPPAPTITGVSPTSGTDAGGTKVTITGTNLVDPTVAFGLEQTTDVTCTSDTSCTANSPPGGAGPVDVRVTTEGGTSARTAADKFTYVAANKAPTSVKLTLSPNPTPSGSGYSNLTAQVQPSVDGTVQFSVNGSPLTTVTAEDGYASTYVSNLAAGTYQITAEFIPTDSDFYATGTAEQTLTVTAVTAPQNTTPPSISGVATQGETLTATPGVWSGTSPISYSYEWERCSGSNCTPILGAYSLSYVLSAADVGHTIEVQVTALNAAERPASATSAPTAVVQAASTPPPGGGGPPPPGGNGAPSPPSNTSRPAISGPAMAGATLTSSTGAWNGTPPLSYSYRWLRCTSSCSAIAGASTSSYALSTADVGANIAVVVTASNGAGSASATSAQLGPVAPSAGQVKAALTAALKVSGKLARSRQLLKHGGYVLSFSAPSAGRLIVDWYFAPKVKHAKKKARPVLVGKLSASLPKAGKAKLKLRLTQAGRKLLKQGKRLKLSAKGSFTPLGASMTSATRGVSIRPG